jgi:hypothetical protein
MYRRALLLLAWASICLRLMIPMGTMPTDGQWYLILCPDGMTVKQMMSVSSDHQQHSSNEVDLISCDFALLSVNEDSTLTSMPDYIAQVQPATILKAQMRAGYSVNRRTHFQPRAPPSVRFFYS